jgi:class 3 adenylate cyclase
MRPNYAIAAAVIVLLVLKRRKRRPIHVSNEASDNATWSRTNPESIPPRPLDITAVFTNLNDFVELFSELGDTAGAALLNEYYGIMAPIVRRNRGFLCTFQFDRLFFFFGEIFEPSSRNHASGAIQTVLEMQSAIDQLNQKLIQRGLKPWRMRAGIASGNAIVGDIGSPQCSEFTAIGPAVNLAKRLEQACKLTNACNLIDAVTRARATTDFEFRPIPLPSIQENESPMPFFEAFNSKYSSPATSP